MPPKKKQKMESGSSAPARDEDLETYSLFSAEAESEEDEAWLSRDV